MEATLEPVSPELVLVTPGLRSFLVDRWETGDEDVLRPGSRADDRVPAPGPLQATIPVVVQFALYAGWQALTGALFGLVAFVVFVALLLLKPFIPG